MAQDFEGAGIRVSNSETVLRTVDSDDAVVGIRVANITTAAVTVDVYVEHNDGGGDDDYYLVKDAPVPAGGSLELIDGGSKIILMSGDRLLAECGTANGIDAWISTVDAVST